MSMLARVAVLALAVSFLAPSADGSWRNSVQPGETPMSMLANRVDKFTAPLSKLSLVRQSRLNILPSVVNTVQSLTSCLKTGRSFEDPWIGHFDINDTYYCRKDCVWRNVKSVTCCAPESPDELEVIFHISEPGKPVVKLTWPEMNDPTRWSPSAEYDKYVMVVHGFFESVSTSPWMQPLNDGWVARGNNLVIMVDWRHGNQFNYFVAAANTRIIGAMMGQIVLNLNRPHKTLLVGFSLGGHIIGQAGRYTQEKAGVLIDECHGLDPAGPSFTGCADYTRLTKDDCRLVQVIHTSAEVVRHLGPLTMNLGTIEKSGHCDYWVNGGHSQKPCVDLDFPQLIKGMAGLLTLKDAEITKWIESQLCSHVRAPMVYVSQLTGTCDYLAKTCDDCGEALACQTNGTVADIMIPCSLTCSPDMDVDYYVSSGSFHPYCSL